MKNSIIMSPFGFRPIHFFYILHSEVSEYSTNSVEICGAFCVSEMFRTAYYHTTPITAAVHSLYTMYSMPMFCKYMDDFLHFPK